MIRYVHGSRKNFPQIKKNSLQVLSAYAAMANLRRAAYPMVSENLICCDSYAAVPLRSADPQIEASLGPEARSEGWENCFLIYFLGQFVCPTAHGRKVSMATIQANANRYYSAKGVIFPIHSVHSFVVFDSCFQSFTHSL